MQRSNNIFDERDNITRTIALQRSAGQVKKKKKRRKKKDKEVITKKDKKGKPLCQTNIFVQCPGTRKSVRKKTNAAVSRRGGAPPKSQTQIEVDAEEKRAQIRRDDDRLRLDRERSAAVTRLEREKFDLRRREIMAAQLVEADRRQAEFARIDLDRVRFDTEVRNYNRDRAEAQANKAAEIADLRERVARDDAFRHRQLEETQRLAFEQLAEQRRDNTSRRELETRKIDNQRAVDAERAITDREKEQTLQAGLEALRFQIAPSTERRGPEINVEALRKAQSAARAPTGGAAEELPRSPVLKPEQQPPRGTPQGGAGQQTDTEEFRRRAEAVRRQTSQIVAGLDESLRDVDEAGSLASSSTASSLSERERSLLGQSSPDVQRLAAIQGGRKTPRSASPSARASTPSKIAGSPEGTPTFRDKQGKLRPKQPPGQRQQVKQRIAARTSITPARRTLSGALREGVRGETPERPERPLDRPPSSVTSSTAQQEEFLPGQIVGAVGTGLGAAGRLAGGAVGGVAQGLFEQLPSAGDVGAAVGRGGVRFATGVAGAAYQGLSGVEPEPEPTPRQTE
tara:strand:+ start:1921 stop:3627 length:1707 start_codon:yes stop_codon:yes gene_type:complete